MNAAKGKARGYLRQGEGFIWNATNLSRDLRQQLIALFANYKARAKVVYVEFAPDTLYLRNRARQIASKVAVARHCRISLFAACGLLATWKKEIILISQRTNAGRAFSTPRAAWRAEARF